MINNIEAKVINILKRAGAIISNDHIVTVSGRHTDTYINPDTLLPKTIYCSQIGELFARKFMNKKVDVIVGPAIGGIIFSQWVAHHLSILKNKEVLGLFTEKTPDVNQIFSRGFDKLVIRKNVLIIEDITTTGGSVKKVVDRVREHKGKVVSVAVIVNRDPKKVNSKSLGAPFHALATLIVDSWPEKECPLCKKGIPINTKVGHGKEYLAERGKK